MVYPGHVSSVLRRNPPNLPPLFKVGNPAFANYVDAHVSLTHINNRYSDS